MYCAYWEDYKEADDFVALAKLLVDEVHVFDERKLSTDLFQ